MEIFTVRYYLLLTTSLVFVFKSGFSQASQMDEYGSSSSSSASSSSSSSSLVVPVKAPYKSDFEQMFARNYLNLGSFVTVVPKGGKALSDYNKKMALSNDASFMVSVAKEKLDFDTVGAMKYLVWCFQELLIENQSVSKEFIGVLRKLKSKKKIGKWKKNDLQQTFDKINTKQKEDKEAGYLLIDFIKHYSSYGDKNIEPYLTEDERKYKHQSLLKVLDPLLAYMYLVDENNANNLKDNIDFNISLWTKVLTISSDEKKNYAALQLAAIFHTQNKKEESKFYWKMAAEGGNPVAQYNYGVVLVHEGDKSGAIPYFQQSLDSGYEKSRIVLAQLVQELKGVTDSVIRNLDIAASDGDSTAQYNLGVCLRDGDGVEQDLSKARVLFERSAHQGNVSAQHNLAIMMNFGDGGPQDLTSAFYWFEKAVAQESSYSKLFLSHMLHDGKGCTTDRDRAKSIINDLLTDESLSVELRYLASSEHARQAKEWEDVQIHLSNAILLGGGDDVQGQIDNLKKTFDSEKNVSDDDGESTGDDSGNESNSPDAPNFIGDEAIDLGDKSQSFEKIDDDHSASSSSAAPVQRNKKTKDKKKQDQSKRNLIKFLETHQKDLKKTSKNPVSFMDLKVRFANEDEKNEFQTVLNDDSQNGKALTRC